MADKATAASPLEETQRFKSSVYDLRRGDLPPPVPKAFIFDWQERLISQVILSKN